MCPFYPTFPVEQWWGWVQIEADKHHIENGQKQMPLIGWHREEPEGLTASMTWQIFAVTIDSGDGHR